MAAGSTKDTLAGGSAPALSPYSLRDGQHEIALHEGDTLVGRSSDCAIILDGALVSRRHAIFRVQGTRVVISDLGSRNGTAVNGKRVRGSTALEPSDQILVGDVELQLVERISTSDHRAGALRQAQTMAFESVQPDTEPAPARGTENDGPEEETSTGQTFALIGGVVDKFLAMKKTAEAVRLLEGPIGRIWTEAKRGRPIDAAVADSAADYAVRLAEATEDARWVVKALDIFVAQDRPLPLPIIDRLYTLLRRLPNHNRLALDSYVENLQARRNELSAAERFALKRLEGLIRIASL